MIKQELLLKFVKSRPRFLKETKNDHFRPSGIGIRKCMGEEFAKAQVRSIQVEEDEVIVCRYELGLLLNNRI